MKLKTTSKIMAKDPRFNFYVDNWVGGTKRMTFEQKGAYIELLVLNFYCLSDGVPGFTEPEAIHALAGKKELWDMLKPKFSAQQDLFCNERLLREFQKSRTYSEKQAVRSKKRWGGDAAGYPAEDAAAYPLYGIGNGIGNKREIFVAEVNAFTGQYRQTMLDDFIRYWTEMTPDKTKMKFQMQKTFEIKLRLITWARNETKFGKTITPEAVSSQMTSKLGGK